ncbi:hypothetical protein [Bacillus cereus]|uniref:hypothetical protein n=1 Tax=Bacillus cereus TaxID=1396 RepID=UPI0018F79275|nr:hypothetical protein [Bacillus cereus]MBJ8026205.1 hypothetical protein [Bacillus cereus]MBJ8038487.1 hypothetical protein [Bacillus cereus]
MMFNYTDAGLKNILAPMKSEQKEFQKHIENTYKAYEQKKINTLQKDKNIEDDMDKKRKEIFDESM